MYKDKLIIELEKFREFSVKTKMKKMEPPDMFAFEGSGHPPEEYAKYPAGTPGIHPYWDAEMENIACIDLLLAYLKDGVFKEHNVIWPGYVKRKINTIHHLLLNPQFDTFLIGETNRGIELVILKCIKEDKFKKVYCYDERAIYGRWIKEYFNDERIIFYQQATCTYELELLKDENILMILNNSPDHALRHFINEPKIGLIIMDGLIADRTKHWKAHRFNDRSGFDIKLDEEFDRLKKVLNV